MKCFGLKYNVFFTLLFLVGFAPGCREEVQAPQDLMSFEEMVGALEMVYIHEVKAIGMYDLGTQKDEYMKDYLYPAIFDSLGIADSVFYQSYDYYEQQPLIFETMLDSVIASIERMPADSSASIDIADINAAYKQIRMLEQDRKKKEKQAIE